MKLLVFFTASLLAGLAYTAPASKPDDIVTITKEFFPDELAIYTAEHEIFNLLVPLNALNFDEDSDDEDGDDSVIIFFVLADIEDGKRTDKGLYVRNGEQVTKLLENGRDSAAANDDTKTVYLGAKEGLYIYNAKENKAEKYGTVDDSIISIAKVNGSDIIYILTEEHDLYKVTEEGTKKDKIDSVVNAQQIVLDYENNLYYYTSDKKVYVLNQDGVKKIEGIPEDSSYINVLKPPFILENGVPVVIDNKAYIAYPNGTSEATDFQLNVHPSAYSMEATLIQYFAYDKKIYEYNIITILLGELLEDLKGFLQDKSDSISEIATRSRSDLRA